MERVVEARCRERALHRLGRRRDLDERLAEAHRDTAQHLTPNVGCVDDPPEIVHCDVTHDVDCACVRVDLNFARVTAVGAAAVSQRRIPLAVQ